MFLSTLFAIVELICPDCGYVHDTIDATTCLQLPLPIKRTRIIEVIFLDANNPRVPFTIYGLEVGKFFNDVGDNKRV